MTTKNLLYLGISVLFKVVLIACLYRQLNLVLNKMMFKMLMLELPTALLL